MNLTSEETKVVIMALRKHRSEFQHDVRDTLNAHEYLQTSRLSDKFMAVYQEQIDVISKKNTAMGGRR